MVVRPQKGAAKTRVPMRILKPIDSTTSHLVLSLSLFFVLYNTILSGAGNFICSF